VVCVLVFIGVYMCVCMMVVFVCVSVCVVCACVYMWLEKLPGMTFKTRLKYLNTRSTISGPTAGCYNLIPIST
jgi:uncharacterized membrane protein